MTSQLQHRAVALLLAACLGSAHAAAAPHEVNTASRILYHDGPVIAGQTNVYAIWYGCWGCGIAGADAATQIVLTDFLSSPGMSRYAQINSSYADGSGQAPSGAILYGGSISMATCPFGNVLRPSDVGRIVNAAFEAGLGARDDLIPQNWVNAGRGHCAMAH